MLNHRGSVELAKCGYNDLAVGCLQVCEVIGRNPFNQNFRAEVRKFLGVEWIATGSNGLVPFHSQNEFRAQLK